MLQAKAATQQHKRQQPNPFTAFRDASELTAGARCCASEPLPWLDLCSHQGSCRLHKSQRLQHGVVLQRLFHG